MNNIKSLEEAIEIARRDLDEALTQKDRNVIYQKSVYLDQLIEKYLDMKESTTSYH